MAHWLLGMRNGVRGQLWGLGPDLWALLLENSLRDWIWLVILIRIPGQGLDFEV